MNDVINMTKIGSGDLPNRNIITPDMGGEAAALLPRAVDAAKEIMQRHCDAYNERINPQIDEELDKLSGLQKKHKDYQLSLFDDERRRSERERKVNEIFDSFVEWVRDTLEIENNPYIRIAAVMMGGK